MMVVWVSSFSPSRWPHHPRCVQEPPRILLVNRRGHRGVPHAGSRALQGRQPRSLRRGVGVLRVSHQTRYETQWMLSTKRTYFMNQASGVTSQNRSLRTQNDNSKNGSAQPSFFWVPFSFSHSTHNDTNRQVTTWSTATVWSSWSRGTPAAMTLPATPPGSCARISTSTASPPSSPFTGQGGGDTHLFQSHSKFG